MNGEAKANSLDSQEKVNYQNDANSSQETDQRIEIVQEVSNILDNLVKKVEKSNESDDENPSEDGNIFKTESKVNDMEKSEKDNTIERQSEDQKENQNEIENEEQEEDKKEEQKEDKTENQNEDKNENEQKEIQTETQEENSNDNDQEITQENNTKMEKEKGEIESIISSTAAIIINTPNKEEEEEDTNNNNQGVLENIISTNVNTIVTGKVDISTETDHKEKKESNKKNKEQEQDQDKPNQKEKNNNSKNSETNVQKALDDMLKKKLLPDIKIRPDVIIYARQVCEEKMMNEEYDQAINIDIAIDIMFTSLEDANVQKQQVNENVVRRLQQTKERKEEVEKNWNDRINEQKKINSQKVLELTKSHEKEKTAFINEWNDPQSLVAFSKPSAKLFHLRKQQKTLALVHDFEGAKILKNEADQLEKRETSEGLRKAESSMKNQYLMLLDRQKREMQCLVDNSNTAIEKLEMFKLKELSSIENAEKVLQSRMTSSNSLSSSSSNASISPLSSQSLRKSKLASNPTVIVPNVNSNSSSKSRLLSSSVLNRRARSQMASYKAQSETWRLKLKMNDVSKTIRSVEPAAKNRQTTTL